MKIPIFIALLAYLALTNCVFVPPRPGHYKQHLLGARECTWGPSYWCQNLTSAANCHAVKHCIQTVWIHKQLPPDSSSVCQICLDMVKQARDQLESNETQELIKEVFEGSCALLHIKPIMKECDKICDQFIPELIDTLASEMNPQVVCSVAGLCNNERVHQLLIEAGEEIRKDNAVDTCKGCHTVLDILEDKFNKMSRDDVLQALLGLCGRTGSLSDACSNIVITYYTEIYKHLQENFNANNVCLLSGECHAQFHTHANVEITPISHIGYVSVNGQQDDLPCELCEQLVQHLRDLLIANTTKLEFKEVLEGLCKQTKSFSSECLSLVDEYYAVAYDFLTNELNANTLCKLATICPNNDTKLDNAPIVPLLPVENVQEALAITPASAKKPLIQINMAKDGSSVKILQTPEQAQLPIDLLMPPHTQVIYDSQKCVFCEYFLHYVQQYITESQTQEEIKNVIDHACEKLPSSVSGPCEEFVDMYEPALLAILAQEIDPSQVCPLLRICPSSNIRDVEIFMHQQSDGSKCPLCLFAVSRLEEMIKDKKTEENIKDALNKLCSKLPGNLAEECDDFVQTYTDELVEMLLADLTPQEVCVYLRLCTDNNPPKPDIISGDTETNAIPDDTINGKPSTAVEDKPQCVICEFVMKELQDELKNNKTESEIMKAVHDVCNILPKSVKKECNDFVNQYGDMVIQLLIEATEPAEICRMINLCASKMKDVEVEIFECATCEAIVYTMEKILDNPKVDHTIDHVLKKTCLALPRKERKKCTQIIDEYGKMIYDLIISQMSKSLICKEIGLCKSKISRPSMIPGLVGSNKCSWGPGYWCANEENANECGEGARIHCEQKVWRAKTKRDVQNVGSNKCTWGPGYWCASEQNANECGEGAKKHCQEKVWTNKAKRDITKLPGTEKCTWGPSYWCASEQNANECGEGAIQHCRDKLWTTKSKRQTQLVGSSKCTRGPSYWCASEQNANECGEGAKKHCQEKVWATKVKGDIPAAVGVEKCTWGPSYWCASEQNANECGEGAKRHCQEKVWATKIKRDISAVGTEKCTWGPSYWCASEQNANECGEGAKRHCQEKVWATKIKRDISSVGTEKCTWGPSYWCASEQNANECGEGAKRHCRENVWATKIKRDIPTVGAEKCAWGPSYWCASEQNANECGEGAKKHCQEKVWATKIKRDISAVGAEKCTWGPSYWCASEQNANECGEGAKKHCQEKVWATIIKRDIPAVGAEKCTWGPSYWCASEQNANECGEGAKRHCRENVWATKIKRDIPAVGAEKCTWGPSYWCASEQNANECGEGAKRHCQEKVWATKIKRDIPAVGAEKCTWGPSYWCASEQNANECGEGAKKHCQEKVWSTKTKREAQLVGSNKCTWGPGYWCASENNANECGEGAKKHCQEKVWLAEQPKA